MEFPETGKQCCHPDCKQLDFLPVICGLCEKTFCKDHSIPLNHNCNKIVDNVIATKPVIVLIEHQIQPYFKRQ